MDLRERLLTTDYLVGFVDGEGSFLIAAPRSDRSRNCYRFALSVTQRTDGAAILLAARDVFGGRVSLDRRVAELAAGQSNAKPRLHWQVAAASDLLRLVTYFDGHTPVVKADEYRVWREALLVYYGDTQRRGRWNPIPAWLIQRMEEYRAELKRLKQYDEAASALPPSPRQMGWQTSMSLADCQKGAQL